MGEMYVHIYTEISKIEMCIWRSPYFNNFQNKKNLNFFSFFSILFRNLVQSIHLTTCRSMFSEANACTRIAGSGEIFCELALYIWIGYIHWLYTSEKSRAVRKKCCLSEGCELSVTIDKCKKHTNGTGSGFRRWTRTEYHFDIGVEGSMSQGLQLKN